MQGNLRLLSPDVEFNASSDGRNAEAGTSSRPGQNAFCVEGWIVTARRRRAAGPREQCSSGRQKEFVARSRTSLSGSALPSASRSSRAAGATSCRASSIPVASRSASAGPSGAPIFSRRMRAAAKNNHATACSLLRVRTCKLSLRFEPLLQGNNNLLFEEGDAFGAVCDYLHLIPLCAGPAYGTSYTSMRAMPEELSTLSRTAV
jgi:hypothetical protein